MNRSKAEAIVAHLLINAAELRYGSFSVSAKMHDGMIVEISYSRTENTREQDSTQDSNQKKPLSQE